MKIFGFIDPPGQFAKPDEWRDFIAELEKIEPRTDQIAEAIASARDGLKSSEDANPEEEDDDFSDLLEGDAD